MTDQQPPSSGDDPTTNPTDAGQGAGAAAEIQHFALPYPDFAASAHQPRASGNPPCGPLSPRSGA